MILYDGKIAFEIFQRAINKFGVESEKTMDLVTVYSRNNCVSFMLLNMVKLKLNFNFPSSEEVGLICTGTELQVLGENKHSSHPQIMVIFPILLCFLCHSIKLKSKIKANS